MRVLIIAPQPFFQERGTPIAVRLAVEAIARQLPQIDGQHAEIDLLVYNEGEEISIPGVRIVRAKTPHWLRGVRPGISCKKLLCDCFLFAQALNMLLWARGQKYDLIHAVEEAVFFAWFAKKIVGVPYVYDMDSSLALQVTERWWWCRPALALLQFVEGVAVRGSLAVAPVCDALAGIAQRHGSSATVMLRDVSLLASDDTPVRPDRSVLFAGHVAPSDTVLLYVGNLESYQGIDLLLESFARVCPQHDRARLVVIGGTPESIKMYRDRASALGCGSAVLFMGPKPLSELRAVLESADILVSPRIKGNNTPMKIYSYLHSGTATIATDLPTHNQVLNSDIALLATPDPASFAQGLAKLISEPQLRTQLGQHAKAVAQQLYTPQAFERQIAALYSTVAGHVQSEKNARATMCGNL